MDDQQAIAILQWFTDDNEEREAAQRGIAAIEMLAKIRTGLRGLIADPFDVLIDAGREVMVIRADEVQALLEPKP